MVCLPMAQFIRFCIWNGHDQADAADWTPHYAELIIRVLELHQETWGIDPSCICTSTIHVNTLYLLPFLCLLLSHIVNIDTNHCIYIFDIHMISYNNIME